MPPVRTYPSSSSATRVMRFGSPMVSQTRRCMALGARVKEVPNLVGSEATPAAGARLFDKLRPTDGTLLCRVARSSAADVQAAVDAARVAQPEWATKTPVERGHLVRELAVALQAR